MSQKAIGSNLNNVVIISRESDKLPLLIQSKKDTGAFYVNLTNFMILPVECTIDQFNAAKEALLKDMNK